jgi:hypothetical protein
MAARLLNYASMAYPGLQVFAGAAETALTVAASEQQKAMAVNVSNRVLVIAPILPQLMRSARVGKLAEDKGCAFQNKPV